MRYKEVKEGLGTFLVPVNTLGDNVPKRSDDVFFNIHQEINRDFSILALRAYAKVNDNSKLHICEPLCGTGIRSVRYVMETPTSTIYSNDMSINAVNNTRKNINRLPPDKLTRIKLHNMECNYFLQRLNDKHIVFDFIDVDPFGTPIPFVHNSVQLITNKGLLAFTATDLASLAGVYLHSLYSKYGVSFFDKRIGNIHELSARSLITGIQRVGLTQNQSLIPILTLYHRHFIRAFFIRYRGVSQVLKRTGFIIFCQKCEKRFQILLEERDFMCQSCNNSKSIIIAGPLYLGLIQDKEYLEVMLKDDHLHKLGTKKKLCNFLTLMYDEASLDIPWSFDIPEIAKKNRVQVPSIQQISSKLVEQGFHYSKTHFSGSSIKTNASECDLSSIIRTLRPRKLVL